MSNDRPRERLRRAAAKAAPEPVRRLVRSLRSTGGGLTVTTLDAARRNRVAGGDHDHAAALVRALYVAILEREPDAEGLAYHSHRVSSGLPLEILAAELARARDVESPGRVAESLPAKSGEELTRLQAMIVAHRRQLLAVSRRLAVLEDRLAQLPAARPEPETKQPRAG